MTRQSHHDQPRTDATPAEQRAAKNEALWREVNERIDEAGERMHASREDPLLAFHCECGRADCHAMVSLTRREYERVRSQRDRFAVFPGHEQPAVEHVIERDGRYVLVDKVAAVEPLVGADGIPDSGS